MNKYNNKITVVNGISFHSKKEAHRYESLLLMQKAGEIKDLTLQPKFLLQKSFTHKGKNHRKIEYFADFRYIDSNGEIIIEDVKSYITKKNPVYSLKKKLLLFNYPEINFIET